MVRGVTSDLQVKRISTIHKRLANVQKNAPLSDRMSSYTLWLFVGPKIDGRLYQLFPLSWRILGRSWRHGEPPELSILSKRCMR